MRRYFDNLNIKIDNYFKTHKAANFMICLFFLLICFLIYFNSLNNDFLFDDKHLIINNAYIKHAKFIPRIFITDYFHSVPFLPVSYYRAIPILTHALEYNIWKLNPFGYHLTNVVIHSLNSYLVFYLIFLLFGNINVALVSSLLFAISPIQHTTVSLIFNRAELLLLFFIIITIINYLLFMRSLEIGNYILSIIFFTLAVFTKENAVLLIPLLFLCVYLDSRLKKGRLIYFLPFVIVYLIYIYFRLFLIKIPFPQYDYNTFNLNFISQFINFLNIIMHYLILLILPRSLYYHRGISPITIPSLQVILVFVFWLVVGGSFFWSIKNKKSIVWWGMAWFMVGISSVMKSMHTFGFSQLAMMEHWLYLPSIGFFIIFGSVFSNMFRHYSNIAISLFICLIISWIFLTIHYNKYGRNEYIFYKYILDISPNNSDARFNMANYFLEVEKNLDEAEKQFKIVLVSKPHRPDKPDVFLGLGNVYLEKKNFAEAMKWYKETLRYVPLSAVAWNNIGLIYQNQGNKKAALNSFLTALKCNSELDIGYANLGNYYLKNGDYKKAMSYFIKAVELDPDKDIYFTNLGVTYAAQNLVKEALVAFNKALEINPKSIDAIFNLGNLYANYGHFGAAIKIWKEALIFDPNNENIKNNIKTAEDLIKNNSDKNE